jgi:hypothetical protein
MLRVEHIIKHVRRQTDNETIGTDQGMSDEEIIRYLNDAQDDIYGDIVNTFRGKFYAQEVIAVSANVASYATPSKAFMDDQIAMIEWSLTGFDRDYRALKRVTMRERCSVEGWPSRYAVSNKKIFVWPVPVSPQGNLRVTYNKKVPTMDKRRAQVNVATIALGVLTGLTLKGVSGAAISATEVSGFSNEDYLCVVSADGTILCEGIGYTAVSALGVVTLSGNHTLLTGETIPTGAYIVLGSYASTHSEMPDDIENYLMAYAAWAVYKRDSNSDLGPQQQTMVAMKQSILDNYAEMNLDIDWTPEVNTYFDW